MDYGTILLGATALSCGALSAGEDVLCIERGVLLAQEYCQGYAAMTLSAPQSGWGHDLYDELAQRGLFANGRLHCPPVADVLARRLLERKAALWLGAEVLDVSACPGGFSVSVFGMDGLRTVTASRVIDTTSEGLWHCARQLASYKKEVRVPLLKTTGELPDMPGGAYIEWGALENEAILCVPVASEASWTVMRFALRDTWQSLYAHGIGWTMAAEPVEASILYDAPVCAALSRGWTFCPSVAQGDLMRAFEEGCTCV